jgi:aminopeptidase
VYANVFTELPLADPRNKNFARILIDHSARIKPGDRVGITTTTAAEPLVRELFTLILERGAQPHILMDIQEQEALYIKHARAGQLDYISPFQRLVYEQFDVLFKIRAELNTRALAGADPQRHARRQKGLAPLLAAQMKRGADGSLRWVSTMFPTPAYAMEADMGLQEYQNFFYAACFADGNSPDPVAEWQKLHTIQQGYIERIEGHDLVELRGPNVDLRLSIKGRTFVNAGGRVNMPDGEIYTGPVEDSANGWVRFTYPAIYQGHLIQGVELTFKNGKIVKASAEKNEEALNRILDSDAGSRYLGEFAIGTNYNVSRFTKNTLFDEKIGGSFHMAMGAGYPETGSKNHSVIHWDMVCDMRKDSQIRVDSELVYKDGRFLG